LITKRRTSPSGRVPVAPVLLVLAGVISACLGVSQEVAMPTLEPAHEPQPGLPNPASVYCAEHDGRLEIRTAADGGQFGVCVFADSSECEEWAYFRGECAPGQSTAVPVPMPAPANALAPDVAVDDILAHV
jgi:putative hemolysin